MFQPRGRARTPIIRLFANQRDITPLRGEDRMLSHERSAGRENRRIENERVYSKGEYNEQN
jgi:hypothetical protein